MYLTRDSTARPQPRPADPMSKTEQSPPPKSAHERDAYDWAVLFASGEAKRADVEALKRWASRDPANAEAFDRASSAWQIAGIAAPEQDFSTRQRLKSRQAGPSRRLFIGGALAASVSGVLVVRPPLDLWPSWSELSADYRTDIGGRRQVALPDELAIDMNSRTSIARLSSKPGDEQVELVTGEALFSMPVAVNTVLTVVAGDGRIAARNARFNVRCDDATVCVTCLDGEALVERNAARQPLKAGEQIVYSARGFGTAMAADIPLVTAWRSGLLIFQATPITEVVSEINRYRPGKVILTNATLGRERFSARFRTEKVDQVVYQIEQIFHARVTALPGGIILLG